jgi:hypothetical protein
MINMNRFNSNLLLKPVLVLSLMAFAHIGFSKEVIGLGKRGADQLFKKASGCEPASQQKDLDINNVRTTILNGGDMWWNLSNARYEVPKVGSGQVSKHSLFAGALWIGGITQGNLRIAAQTYRQSGNDYYPGPLQVDGAAKGSVSKETCKAYDQIWKITLQEIDQFRNNPDNWSSAPDVITTWPGNGKAGEARILAPFVDYNNDGIYDPVSGDYPSFDFNNPQNIPDMMLYMISPSMSRSKMQQDQLDLRLQYAHNLVLYHSVFSINQMEG